MAKTAYCSVARNLLSKYGARIDSGGHVCSRSYSKTVNQEADTTPRIPIGAYNRQSDQLDSSLTNSLVSNHNFFAYSFKSDFLVKKHRELDPLAAELIDAIVNLDISHAQFLLKQLLYNDHEYLRKIPRNLITKLMCLYETSKVRSVTSFEELTYLAQAVKNAGYHLNATEYAQIISCAFKAHKYDEVEHWWNEVNASGIEKTVDLWNSYLQAATNGFSPFWPVWRPTRDQPLRRKLPVLFTQPHEPVPVSYARMDGSSILRDMLLEGISPNARTYELMILYFAQMGEMDSIRSILQEIWGIEKYDEPRSGKTLGPRSSLYPSLSTLHAISDSFGFADAVIEGLYYVKEIQQRYNISVTGTLGEKFWSNMLKWVFYTTKSNTPEATFDLVWKIICDNYQIKPGVELYRWRGKRLASLREYDEMIQDIPKILAIPHESEKAKLSHAAHVLKTVVRKLAVDGNVQKAFELLETWGSYSFEFEETKRRCQEFLSNNQTVQKNLRSILPVEKVFEKELSFRKDSLFSKAISFERNLPYGGKVSSEEKRTGADLNRIKKPADDSHETTRMTVV